MAGRDFDYVTGRPVGVASTVAAVLGLAIGSGVTVGIGLLAVCWAAEASARLALAGAGLAVLGVWAVAISRVWALFWHTERVTPTAGASADVTRPVLALEISDVDRHRIAYVDLPCTPEQLTAVARGILQGRPFSENEWSGRGRLWARSEFRQVRSAMIDRGLLAWRHPSSPGQGVELTSVGRHVFRQLAEGVDVDEGGTLARTRAPVRPAPALTAPPEAEKGRAVDYAN